MGTALGGSGLSFFSFHEFLVFPGARQFVYGVQLVAREGHIWNAGFTQLVFFC
jgi:hypothetical protein